MSNASHGHIIGRPIYQQYETVPYANPLLSRASDRTSLSILNTRPQSSGVRPVSVARLVSAARGQQQDKRRTRGGQQQDKRRQEERKTRPQSLATGARPRPVSVARAGQRGQDNSRTREGHQQEKRRTRPGHRARPQSSGARPVSVASSFVLRQRPNSKLLGEYIDLYIYIYMYIYFFDFRTGCRRLRKFFEVFMLRRLSDLQHSKELRWNSGVHGVCLLEHGSVP